MTEYSLPSTLESVPTLFCLPYAGGAASAFWGMRKALADAAEVVPIHLPGRESRIAEPPRVSVGEIADEMASRTRRPYAVYGHSMGARIAFEVVRELRRRALPLPVCLYVGGAHPPDRKVPIAAAVDLPDDAFIDQLISRAGAREELRDMPELRELAMPVLRSDFGWIKEYRYTPEPPLDVPLVAFAGLDDAEVPPSVMLGWGRHTRSRFDLRAVRGGHLFLADRHADLTRFIARDLAGDGGPEPLEDDEVHLWLVTGNTSAADLVDMVTRRCGSDREALRCGTVHHDGLALAAVTRGHPVGVAIGRPGTPDGDALDDGSLGADEREQIEGTAEEDRPWVALRARTAKKALAAGSGADPALIGFPDLTAPGPWRPLAHRDPSPSADLTPWRVTHLPLPTPQGEVVAAVALPHDRMRLRFTALTGGSR
ncbi:thioesterase II family protein [Sphaerisporangium flaviroseum]|uniref:thioesterase II family protein n=1 Tax=Sphaerisporangium flaviroseum TaxID=509199 RepID=UPI0031E50819